jgi:hypothetical protein
MEPRQLKSFLESLGLELNRERMTWVLRLNNRTEISYEMLSHGGNEKDILLHTFRKMRRDLDHFIMDLERKVIEYE